MSSKSKGNKNERDVAKYFKTWTGYDFGRTPQSGALRWKRAQAVSADIVCTDDKHGRRFPFSIECKFYKDINFEHLLLDNKKVKILEFWEQANDDAERSGKEPLLFMRYNGMAKNTWFVVMNTNVWDFISDKIKQENRVMRIESPESDFCIVNSGDLARVDYKTLYIYIRKALKKN